MKLALYYVVVATEGLTFNNEVFQHVTYVSGPHKSWEEATTVKRDLQYRQQPYSYEYRVATQYVDVEI